MRELLTLTAGDLRQRLRDRSVLIFGLVVPIALMSVMNLVFQTEEIELNPVTVAAAVADDDELGLVVVETLTQVPGLDVTVQAVPVAQVRDLAEDEQADLGLVLPEGFGAAVREGRATEVDLIRAPGSGLEIDILIAVVDGVTDRLTATAVTTAAGAQLGLQPDQLAQIAEQVGSAAPAVEVVQGRTASEQLSVSGTMVAGQAGLFLLFTVGFGVIALINERERGTLARLRSMPLRPGVIVTAKALSAYVIGVVATGVLLGVGSMLFGVSFGSVPLVGLLVLCVVAAATSLTFVVARLARTSEQASVAQAILAVVLGMFGGAFFQITSSGGLAGRLLDLNPIGAFTRGLGITAGGGGLADLTAPLLTMLGFAVVCTVASRLVPDRGAEL